MDLTDEEVKAWMRVFELAGVDVDELGEFLLKIVKTIIHTAGEFNQAMQRVVELASQASAQTVEEQDADDPVAELLRALEEYVERDMTPTARKLWGRRERRRAVKMAGDVRFRQYKARESAWATQKRTGNRRREWRGPDRT